MPELAEVEITRQQLLPVVGQRLLSITITDQKLAVAQQGEQGWGEVLLDIERHGKLLGLVFSDQAILTCHLRMTGKLLFGEQSAARAQLQFEHALISFVDSRRFGTMGWLDREQFANNLGPDLANDFTAALKCWPQITHSRRAIKAVLLDQSVVAGIGNYMVDEALWRVQIAPTRLMTAISAEEWHNLLQAAQDIAREAVDHGGVSTRDYLQPSGQAGQMQLQLACYGRAGQGCLRCHKPLLTARVGGRGTTYCPYCQAH